MSRCKYSEIDDTVGMGGYGLAWRPGVQFTFGLARKRFRSTWLFTFCTRDAAFRTDESFRTREQLHFWTLAAADVYEACFMAAGSKRWSTPHGLNATPGALWSPQLTLEVLRQTTISEEHQRGGVPVPASGDQRCMLFFRLR